jgi:hypothetical protein
VNCTSCTDSFTISDRSFRISSLAAAGSAASNAGKQLLDVLGDLDRVAPGLALDGEDDGARALEPRGGLVVLDAVHDVGDLGEANRVPLAVGDDDAPEPLGAEDRPARLDGVGLVLPPQRAGRDVGVRVPQRRRDLVDPDPTGGERGGVHLDPYRVLL